MDSRLYLVLGDLASNILVGAAVGWLCALVVGVGWNMFLTMLLAMAIGMVVGTILWVPLGMFFGAMEVMLPTMFGGMLSGMVVGMRAAMMPVGSLQALFIGGLCGLAAIAIIWIMNARLRGVRSYRAGV